MHLQWSIERCHSAGGAGLSPPRRHLQWSIESAPQVTVLQEDVCPRGISNGVLKVPLRRLQHKPAVGLHLQWSIERHYVGGGLRAVG